MTESTTTQVRDDVPVSQKRAWLQANAPNVAVGTRGKLSREAEEAFAAAHPRG